MTPDELSKLESDFHSGVYDRETVAKLLRYIEQLTLQLNAYREAKNGK